MPNENNKDDFQADGSAEPQEKSPTEPTKPRISLRKSENRGGTKEERRPRKRLLGKREPEADATPEPPPIVVERPAPTIVAPAGAEDILAHLSWRPKQPKPDVTVDEDKPKPQRKPREPREPQPRQRKEPAAAAVPEQKPEPPKPTRKHIRIPELAAQVIVHEGL